LADEKPNGSEGKAESSVHGVNIHHDGGPLEEERAVAARSMAQKAVTIVVTTSVRNLRQIPA
jgi:hypothetical protein